MPTEGKPDYLALRVLDNNTGTEIVHELAHAHDTKWEVRALQQGMPGSSTLGTFTFHSPGGPMSDEMRKTWRSQWLKLAIGQRVEGYLGNVVAGQPRFSGVITGMKRALDGPWEVTGTDSLWMLQQSQVHLGEAAILGGAPASQSARAFYGTDEVAWDDDFSTWFGAHPNNTDYNITAGGWNFGFDPLFNLPSIGRNQTAGLFTNTTWGAANQFNAGIVTVHGVYVANAGASTGAAGPGVFILSDSTGANSILADLIIQQTAPSSGLYNVSLRLGSSVGGVYTQQSLISNVLPNMPPTFPFELQVIVGQTTLPTVPFQETWYVRFLLNGNDSNCVYTGFAPSGTPGIGLRYAGTLGTAYFTRLQFHARTSGDPGRFSFFGTDRFGQGQQYIGLNQGLNVNGNGQTHLDLLNLAATFDGASIRKNPGAGYKGDVLDYGGGSAILSPGTDYSSAVVLEEGVNISADGTQVATVPEMLGTDVKLNSLPGADSGGSVTWGRIGSPGDAVLTDTVADVGIPGFTMLVNYVRSIQTRKVQPLQAQQVRVIRDSRWLSVGNGAGPRELDTVTIYIPSLNVQRQSAVIQGYDFVEGEGTMLVYLSQLPASAAPSHLTQRIQRQLDNLGTTYAPR